MTSTRSRAYFCALALLTAALLAVSAVVTVLGGRATPHTVRAQSGKQVPYSGVYEFNQAAQGGQPRGLAPVPEGAPEAPPPDAEQAGTNVRVSKDNSHFPKNETTVAVNPGNNRNIVAGANDYRSGLGNSGFYSNPGDRRRITFTTSDQTDPDGTLPMVNEGNGGAWDGGGDPAVDFDDHGRAYFAELFFNRTNPPPIRGRDCHNGVAVSTSDNNGLTWTRPSVTTGSGIVTFHNSLTDCSVVHDKEYIAVDRYSDGDRKGNVYVTWTRFSPGQSPIYFSQSTDRGIHWSTGIAISGSNPVICDPPGICKDNQFSVPAVASDGTIYVVFKNFDTPAENQMVSVRCDPGLDCTQASNWSAPVRISLVFDQHYPINSDGRQTLSNSNFRLGMDTWNVVVDRSATPNKLYAFWSDNRNGGSDPTGNGATGGTGTDVFVSISTDNGDTWTDAARVNQDASRNDHFMGWAAVAPTTVRRPGTQPVCAIYLDRRNDADNKLIETFASCSLDGGQTWTDQVLTDTGPQNHVDLAGFNGGPRNESRFIGDYHGVAGSIEGRNRPFFFAVWTDVRNASESDRHSDIYGVKFYPRGSGDDG